MNTQAHAIINVALLSRKAKPHLHRYALVGAVVPDVPMFVFWAVETLVLRNPQTDIWRDRYYLPEWQNLFDLFNSVPIALLLLGVGYLLKSEGLIVCCFSLLLHAAGDFFLHHDDGHRHFFPLSNFVFRSPVSYWDPAHYGGVVSVVEVLATVVASAYLFPRLRTSIAKAMLIVVNTLNLIVWTKFVML